MNGRGLGQALGVLVCGCLGVVPLVAQTSSPSTAITPVQLVLAAAKAGPAANADLPALLKTALAGPAPAMRLTAARLVAVGDRTALAPDIADALRREQDESVATELLRALLLLNTPSSIADAEAFMPRATRRSTEVFARWLARTDPDRLIERLPTLVARLNDNDRALVFSDALFLAFRYRPLVRAATLQKMLDDPAPTWSWVVSDLFTPARASTDVAAVHDALRSSRSEIREHTVWAVVDRMEDKDPIADVVLDTALEPRGDPADPPTWESFGRELVRRYRLKADTPDRSVFLAREGPAHLRDMLHLRGLSVLTKAETAALRTLLGARYPSSYPRPERRKTRDERVWGASVMRTPPFFLPGFYGALLEETDCTLPAGEGMASVVLNYLPDGRPSRATMVNPPNAKCRAALAALAQMTIADESATLPPGTKDWLLLPIGDKLLRCTDTSIGPLDATTLQDDAIDERPKVKSTAKPNYSAAALRKMTQGHVLLEGTITNSGCVRDVTVNNSLEQTLDMQAALAVLRWTFTPAISVGRPANFRAMFDMSFRIDSGPLTPRYP